MEYKKSDLEEKIEFIFFNFNMIYYPKIQEFAILYKSGILYFKTFHKKKHLSQFIRGDEKITVSKHKLIYYVYNPEYDIFDKKIKILHIDKNKDNNKIENLQIRYLKR